MLTYNITFLFKRLFLLFAIVITVKSMQGETPQVQFNYSFDEPVRIEQTIELNWSILAGSVCNGMTIERSADSVNFQRIGRIEGFCGDANFDVPYDFIDESPLDNQKNHYRIRFGSQAISEIRSLFFVHLDKGEARAFPNPSNSEMTILFRNQQQVEVQIAIYDISGRLVFSAIIQGSDRVELHRNQFGSGQYYFTIISQNEKIASGKFMFQ